MNDLPPYFWSMLVIALIGIGYHWVAARSRPVATPTDKEPAVFTCSAVWRAGFHLGGIGTGFAAFAAKSNDLSQDTELLSRAGLIGAALFLIGLAEYLKATHTIKIYGSYIVCKKFGGSEEIPFSDLESVDIAGVGINIHRTSGRVLSYSVAFQRAGQMVALLRAGINAARKKRPAAGSSDATPSWKYPE